MSPAPLTRADRNALERKHREKLGKRVEAAVAAPSADGVKMIVHHLKGNDLQDALMAVAEKMGLSASIQAIYAQLPVPEQQAPDMPRSIPSDSGDDQPVSLAQPRKTFPNTPESRLATVYAKPVNQRQRLIEFADDRTHATLWVPADSPVWTGWTVWVKVNPDTRQKGWVLDGVYSWRGIRLQ